jgi:RNA-directed DNA polymerase
VNTDAPWPDAKMAWSGVLKIQTKLHQWATDDPGRKFDDLWNLVCDSGVLVEAWHRVRSNRGARTAGVDGEIAHYVTAVRGEQAFLSELRDELKTRRFQPSPVRQVTIPKPGSTKRRRLGIATVRDRVVQAALKLVLEPIFEADFQPCSYGFRPERRAQDAIAEIHYYTSRSYEWIVEGDIKACFDEISHSALLGRMRARIGDKRVLALVKAFLKSGVLTEDGELQETSTGAPQGGILSPLLSNVALSILDDHFAEAWRAAGDSHQRERRRRKGLANYRLVRYADDWVVMVAGTQADAEHLREEAAAVLLPMGLRLSEEKTRIVHIDQGFDFLGMHIQRHKQRGSSRRFVYTYPSRAALAAVKAKVRDATRRSTNQSLAILLHRLNFVLRGWTNYHRHGAAAKTFAFLSAFTWRRVWCWLCHKYPKTGMGVLRRRHTRNWWPEQDEVRLFKPTTVAITRYRYRGAAIPSSWAIMTMAMT